MSVAFLFPSALMECFGVIRGDETLAHLCIGNIIAGFDDVVRRRAKHF